MFIINSKTEISKYVNAFSVENVSVFLDVELDNIAKGVYKTLITNCRDLLRSGNKAAYNTLKKNLPAITFSGTFAGPHRKENLLNYSKLIVIDIDNLREETIEKIKKRLFNDRYVFAIWISPSGNGLKLLIRISNDPQQHGLCFTCLSEYFKVYYKIEVDKSGSDICRLCFVSYDENLLQKDSEIFDHNDHIALIENTSVPRLEPSSEVKKRHISEVASSSEKILFWATEGKNIGRNRDTLEKIIVFLKRNNKSITNSYNDWFRVALAIANSFTYDLGEKYYLQLCELDGEKFNEYKSKYILEYCYRNRKLDKIEFSTIVYLARIAGFK